jgi:hypothetical protein
MLLWFPFQQDNLSFPLICPDWNADDEILLLEVLLISVLSLQITIELLDPTFFFQLFICYLEKSF